MQIKFFVSIKRGGVFWVLGGGGGSADFRHRLWARGFCLPNLVASNLVVWNFCLGSASFDALLHPYGQELCGLAFCALLRSFVCFCVRLHLEQSHLGTADFSNSGECGEGSSELWLFRFAKLR